MKETKPQQHTLESIRKKVFEILTEESPNLLKTNELSKRIRIKATDPEHDLVRRALEELESEGLIIRTARRRYGRAVPDITVDGRLRMAKRGQWEVIPKEGGDTGIVVDGRSLWTAMHGDLVRAKVTSAAGFGERPRGEVTQVLERANDLIVGTLRQAHRHFFVEPDDRKLHRTIAVRKNRIGTAKVGDKVAIKLYDWNDPYEEPEGTITRSLGRAGEMNAEIESIALTYRLPYVFPDAVLAEAERFPDVLTPGDLKGRRDLRDYDIFTIDPHDARDFDDAVSIEEHDDGDATIGVHIADVSHYVREGSELDREAYKRGTSVYMVTGVIPMLPERLSNDLCSLKPDVDRLTYSVFIRLSPRGAVRTYEITKSVIRSKRRFTYEEALEVLESGKGDYAHELLALNRMAHRLRENRRRKGSVDFSTTELKFRLDENNYPVEVIPKTATESTRLIEDCMLLANRMVAEYVARRKFPKNGERGGMLNPFIYRIHDVPPKEKLLELAQFVKSLGYELPVDNIQPKDIQKLIDSARGSDEEQAITEVTLRSMAKAVYSELNIGHFGLAFQYYTHFTSPIRRYPDLIVHRMLDEYQHEMPVSRRHEYQATLGGIADQCSERERAAVEAERASIKIAEVEYLKRHVGDVFEATISGVMPFGMFAEIIQLGIDGLVRMRDLTDDYYYFDEKARSFKGRRSKKSYRLGDRVYVRVMRVDELKSEIDMEIIDEEDYRRDLDSAPPTASVRVSKTVPSGSRRRSGGATSAAPGATSGRAKSDSGTQRGKTAAKSPKKKGRTSPATPKPKGARKRKK